ncbi:dihydroorotase [Aetokthonos hydrillicola Thurmond2011]|jgi:dihydroorotase|uniref:Dihydroorotase n=1 Tax=Aetokthonos hydrillicola Thurmond2011 TaxID=2712845 RepID=A0AAP5I3H0_9CYAN|nr:dihydroorotase [Aetokthonos hydrillicola]MBO3461846.1 dihydroorotase [Aetokthonos hydrillicola CCALA 1050]MBW4588878.1 dihydroorotase [Aetokthonos hydrillicola CCALA 1050]MDR9894074.1 dihydroorotase [Aetokthonos hydrillicola Thurmond2011]
MTSELLQQVRVIDPVSGTDQIADVLISDGKIQSVTGGTSDMLPKDTRIRDCRGLVLGTGLIDLYSHSGEPGFEERETLLSLLQAAAAGGFTRVSLLPDTSPSIDNPAVVAKLLATKRGYEENTLLSSSLPVVNIWGALTLGVAGKQMTELADLAAAGVVGFADSQPWENSVLVRRVLEYVQPLGKPVAFWCCDRQLAANGVMREGTDSIRFGLPGNPSFSETSAIAALLELVADIGTPVHIMYVSTARGVELIASAKASGLPITASTTWMHLLLDTKAISDYNPSLRLDPPLGNPDDLLALRQAVKTGVVDAIAINHSPYTYEEKTVAFAEAPPGAIGLELALPLLWQNLVETGEFTALELWKALSSNPAECLKQKMSAICPWQQASLIAPGEKAELTLFDPQQTWKVEKQNLYTLSSNTPWLGKQIQGRVLQIWC